MAYDLHALVTLASLREKPETVLFHVELYKATGLLLYMLDVQTAARI